MKRKLLKAGIFLLLVLCIPVFLVGAGLFMPSMYQDSYYAELPDMYDRLASAENKKLVLIGGSNIAFGTDTELLESILHEAGYDYTVCPLGLYAAVGTSAMLELAINTLGEGDIVVLAIEPTSESLSSYFGATAYWKCAEDAPQLLWPMNASQHAALLGNYVPYLQERYALYRSGDVPRAEGVYAAAAFDESCNLIYPREGNTMALGYDSGMPIDFSSVVIADDFAAQVNEFCSRAGMKGAAVYMSFSPVNRSALVGNAEDTANAFFTLCNQTFACPIISDPNHYIFDSGWFYDSNFHLNSAGAALRTCRLAGDVLVQLGDYSAFEYTEPDMPPPAAIETAETTGDDTCFTYAPIAGGAAYLIAGLTDDGLAAASLSVPSSYQGKPVVDFTGNALEGATQLEELYLPEAIESIPDGLFAGCAKLERLILAHEIQPCSITEHAFDGAEQVKIFVPAAALSLYRDGYGCEANIWGVFIDRIYTF